MREEMTTLGESCQFFNGKAHEKDIDAEGQFVVVNSKFISTDSEVKKFTTKQMFPLVEDDIVMVMSDVPNGKALAKCYVIEENDKYSLNQRICAIRTTEFNIRFLYYQLNRHPYLLAFNNGENQTNLRKGDILNCPLWKPTLYIQEQIVKILDEALDQIELAQFNIEQNINNTKELFQSKLNEIFNQKGDGWKENTLGEVCKYDKTKYTDINLPYVGLEHIESNTGTFIGELEPFNVKSSTFQFDERHVLYGRLRPYLNKVLVPDFKGHCSTEIFPILTHESLDREFLFYWFLTPNTVTKIDATWTGARMPRANMNEVIKFKLSIPKVEIQKQIVNQLNDLKTETEEIESHYQQKLVNLEDLKNSILQKAFSGELTKQQEPITI